MSHVILITGGRGFIGKAFSAVALTNGFRVRVSSRQKYPSSIDRAEHFQVGDLGSSTCWLSALKGVESVVHCAGRAHVINDASDDSVAAFRKINLYGTINLARQAVCAGVRRFIFISSIGVNGSKTEIDIQFSETDEPKPYNAYALTKWETEKGLLQIAVETGLELVIIRPPLVYGRNAPGNFGALLRALERGVPLPLGAVHNKRSFLALDNLVDFIVTCITHPQAANQTFLVSDGQDLSTTELVRVMAQVAGIPVRLLPLPVWALQAGASLLGKGDAVQRLCGNLQVDISKARNLLGWEPPVSVEEGLRRAIGYEKSL